MLVGEGEAFGGGGAEDVQDDLADRVGGQLAVLGQLGEGAVAGDLLVLAVGLDQVEQGLFGYLAVPDGLGHGLHDRRAGVRPW